MEYKKKSMESSTVLCLCAWFPFKLFTIDGKILLIRGRKNMEKTPTMQQCFILGIILIIRRQLFLRSKISTLLARNARKPEKTYHFSSIKFKWQLISYSVETHPILQNC